MQIILQISCPKKYSIRIEIFTRKNQHTKDHFIISSGLYLKMIYSAIQIDILDI
jgi:hypothetical protein